LKYNQLGKTGLKVSKLCFGTLTLSPLQKNLSLDSGVSLLKDAYNLGVNFYDTAELYHNYDYLKKAFSKIDDVIISTKSYSYDEKTAILSLEKARKGLDRDIIDVFMLHEQESNLTFKGHMQAIEYFLKMKQKGVIKSFGISTHFIKAVKDAIKTDYIDAIHPLINLSGIGIVDGSTDEMLEQIDIAHSKGIGIYTMKPLGGGHLINQKKEALDFALSMKSADSIAIGIQSQDELIYNVNRFLGITNDKALEQKLANKERKLHVHTDWCIKCGKCIDRCNHNAISFQNDEITIDHDKCVICSYCSSVCSEMAIKII